MEPARPSTPFVETLALLDAVLCADCEMLSNSKGDSCVVCGSRSLLSLARILGGSAGPVRAAIVKADPAEMRAFTVLVNSEAAHVLRQRRRRKQPSLLEKPVSPLEKTGQ
jgi:hypothetical protein